MTGRARLFLPDQEATRNFGSRLAGLIRPGDVIALRGALGVGKTELARAVIRARAGVAIEVPSPSYTLVQDYRLGDLMIRHIDLYRIAEAAELLELGLDAPAADEVWLIEWPERAGDALPPDRLEIELGQGEAPNSRIADVTAGPGWEERLKRCTASEARASSCAAPPRVRGRKTRSLHGR